MQTRSPASALPTSQPPESDTEQIGNLLAAVASVLTERRATQVLLLGERWRSRRLVTLVAGEFKRGKSTLLNALAGQDVLPTGVLPVTAVPTRVSLGPREAAHVRFLDGTEREIELRQLRDYVDESRNPGNRLRVASVEVELTQGLAPDLVVVDVPGLGSTHAHNTEAALAALPEADAALVVVSVDPPIGQAELALLDELGSHAVRVDVVLNKVDYFDAPGREVAERFTRETLARHGFEGVAVWPVSARQGLEARLAGDAVGWRRSGMQPLADSLERFFRQDRERALESSLARKAARLVEQELALVEIRIAASARTSEELHALIEAFSERRTTAERDTAEAVLVFQRRFDMLFSGYTERAAEAWRGPREALQGTVARILHSRGRRSRSAVWQDLESAAHAAAAGFIDAFLASETKRLHSDYQRLRDEVARAAAERAEAVWRMAAELLPFSPPRVEPTPPPAIRRPEALQLEEIHLMLEDLEDALLALLPRRLALRRLGRRAVEEADGRYGRAVEQSRESFSRGYEKDLRELLGRFTVAAAETASGVEAVLHAAEARVAEIERGRRDEGSPEEARRESLRQLGQKLHALEVAG